MLKPLYDLKTSYLAILSFSLVGALTGAIGMIVYGVFVSLEGPIWVRNQYIGLWFSSFILFYSLQAIYLIFKNIKTINNRIFYFDLIYFVACALTCAIIFICFSFALKIDAIVWSIILIILNSVNCFILIHRRKTAAIHELENDENEKFDSNRKLNCCKKTLAILNVILKVIFLIFLCFFAAGSVIIGGYTLKYPPRGKFVTVTLPDDRTLNFHFLCDGPVNDSFPVYMFEGDGSHGYMDYMGLQILLKEQNRRSCIWDKPGLGYSDYLYADILEYNEIYHNLIKSMGEKPPFIFSGWGGGGPTVYDYAYRHPEMVYSLVFLDVAPIAVEWVIPKILKNWTQTEYENNVRNDMASRMRLINLINGLGVPWGLMSLFVPKGQSFPPELRDELNWFMLTDKTWATQAHFMRRLSNQTDYFSMEKLNSNITILNLNTVKSADQVIKQTCEPRKLAPDSKDCKYEIDSDNMLSDMRQKLLNFTKIVNCTLDACSLGYYIFDGPQFTVTNLMEFYKDVSI